MQTKTAQDDRPVLNRTALLKLQQDGLKELAYGLADIDAVRRFALWCKQSGAEVNLFKLLIIASRLTAAHYMGNRNVKARGEAIKVAGKGYPLPGLDMTCQAYLRSYPREDFQYAWQKHESGIAETLVGEMFLLDALVDNPAVSSFDSLFNDSELIQQVRYRELLKKIDVCFSGDNSDVISRAGLAALLHEPIVSAPDSLLAQIAYIKQHWSPWLPKELIHKIDIAQAIYSEETRARLPGPGPTQTPLFDYTDHSSPAAFTEDTDWMSSAIMLAKSIYVWLDQLSEQYHREIRSLADIPEEELARLSRQGFNALWLIGIWERSKASRKIKQLCGNPEAEASAYALHAYRVAADLGGEAALVTLEDRCNRHGIRLACDVVPNHTGIDSEWVIHHPDWFVQANHPPYPAYRFSGPDLCEHNGISIRIEDGYWDHSDAAVVCEYHDHASGQYRYIYHGNDGTHMPWNDTAQLNFLLPQVRKAMSDLIIATARRFKLIRFDAAMTLARKHYRRLWFPPPGGSAGVPSRSQAWMTEEDFNQAFPVEFWREVVDRINREAPDTLLIAEAFWLMESYFVRDLGMHRVYNSAFMNMLKQEDNARYRKVLKDILAYNPEILKRYVNFMNNPDEATAVEQFGKGDKYFGVATLLATLPGLPMFGHGQVEGYREKYGMEYRRAYWEEEPDEGFIAHHEQQIFPLLLQRHNFAGVENFSLYDFTTNDGVNENVYAFSNGPDGQKSLVVYNNSPQATHGRIHRATPKANAGEEGVPQEMPPLWLELGLTPSAGLFCCYRTLQGNEHLSPVDAIQAGLELQLSGYQHQVFSDFRMLLDEDGLWQQLYNRLQNQPVPSLKREKQQLLNADVWKIFVKLLDLERLHVLTGALSATPLSAATEKILTELNIDFNLLRQELQSKLDQGKIQQPISANQLPLKLLPVWLQDKSTADMPQKLLSQLWHGTRNRTGLGVPVIAWLLLRELGHDLSSSSSHDFISVLQEIGLDYAWQQHATDDEQQRQIFLALLLLKTGSTCPATDDETFTALFTDPANSSLLGINHYDETTWFSREGMTALAGAVALQAAIQSLLTDKAESGTDEIADKLRQRLARAAAVGYRLDKFLSLG